MIYDCLLTLLYIQVCSLVPYRPVELDSAEVDLESAFREIGRSTDQGRVSEDTTTLAIMTV